MAATTITSITAREILDSRGNPTLEVSVTCEGGSGVFGVPSGASTGTHEALELRDDDMSQWQGRGVQRAAVNVNVNIAGALVGMDTREQTTIDAHLHELDPSPTFTKLGGNATIGVSIACAKAAANAQHIPLIDHLRSLLPGITSSRPAPYLYLNLINGGKHSSSSLAFQEYHIVPQTPDTKEALMIGTTMMHALKERLSQDLGASSANIGDEGGFAPDIDSVREPLELFSAVTRQLKLEGKVKFALDVAASSFFNQASNLYAYDNTSHTPQELAEVFKSIVTDFPMISIEDPFHEEAFIDFAGLNAGSTLIVGDDLTCTSPARLQQALDAKAISAIIIKPNQIGTLTDTLACTALARAHTIECIVSHRSGETNDDFIADLAIAIGAFGIKAGAPQRGERIAKYNRLLDLLY